MIMVAELLCKRLHRKNNNFKQKKEERIEI